MNKYLEKWRLTNFIFLQVGSVWLLFWRQLREKCEDDSDTDHLFIFYTRRNESDVAELSRQTFSSLAGGILL
jgi:hypothetical protein